MTDLFNLFSKKSIIPYEPPPFIVTTGSNNCRHSPCTKHRSTPSRKTQTDAIAISQRRSCDLHPPLATTNNSKPPSVTTQVRSSEHEINELFEQAPVQRKTNDTQLPIATKPLPPVPSAVFSDALQQTSSSTTRSNRNSRFIIRPSVSLVYTPCRSSAIFSSSHHESIHHGSPEFFIQKFMGTNLRTVSVSDASNLESSLRTRPITWLVKFIDLKGLHVLIICLRKINHQLNRPNKKALDIEYEIIKCIKILINSGVGGIETTSRPSFIHTIVFSLVCPHWQTRKLVCDILAFICYNDAGNSEQDPILGHQHIVRGFELLKQLTNDKELFDTWMKQLVTTLDGRGRMGPLVGAHIDFRKLGVLKFSDKQLMEYATSNMILINALTKVPRNVYQRIFTRNHLNASGMERHALSKLRGLKYTPLEHQITTYENAAVNDLNTIFNDYWTTHFGNSNAEKLLDRIVKGVNLSSKSTGNLLDNSKSLLKTHESLVDIKEYYRHALILQISPNYWRALNDQDITALIGVPAKDLIQHFNHSDRLDQMPNKTASTKITKTPDPDDITILGLQMNALKQHEIDQTRQISLRHSLDLVTETISSEPLIEIPQKVSKTPEGTVLEPMNKDGITSKADYTNDVSVSNRNINVHLQDHKDTSPCRSSSTPIPKGLPSTELSAPLPYNSLSLPPSPPPPPPPSSHVSVVDLDSLHPPPPPPPPPAIGSTPKACLPSSHPYINDTAPGKRMQHQPLKKLKNLQWQKLDSKNMEKTVWSLDDINEADLETKLSQAGVFQSIDTMFTAKTNTTFDRKLKALVDEKMGMVKFLSGNKSRGLSIAVLPKIKHFDDFTFARQTIMRMDSDFCTENMLNNLILYAPSRGDDLIIMEKYTKATVEECHSLDLAEQFTIEMMKMYRYPQRLHFMLFRVQFQEKFNRLYENLTTVANVSDSLLESKSLRELLNIILMMGNYMNGSSLQGGALGIRITSLNKLIDTKASDTTSLTLLHVLAGTIRREFPSILAFVDDLKDTGSAARIMASLNDIVYEYVEMRQKLKQLDDELKTHWMPENVEQGDRFPQVMSEYYEEAIGQFEDLEIFYHNTDDKWKGTMMFYGENPEVMRPDEFFSVFATFLKHWKTASIEEKQYSDKMERKSRQTRWQGSVSKSNTIATTAEKWMCASDNHNDSKYKQSNSLRDNDECESSDFDDDGTNFANGHYNGDRRRMDDLLDRLRSRKSLHGSRRIRHRNQQNTIHGPLETLRTSTSSPVPGSSWFSTNLDGISTGDDSGSLSAEDLLRDLQNGD